MTSTASRNGRRIAGWTCWLLACAAVIAGPGCNQCCHDGFGCEPLVWKTICEQEVCNAPTYDDPEIPNCTGDEIADRSCDDPSLQCEVPGGCGAYLLCVEVNTHVWAACP